MTKVLLIIPFTSPVLTEFMKEDYSFKYTIYLLQIKTGWTLLITQPS